MQEEDEDGDDLNKIIDLVTNKVFCDGAPDSLVVKRACRLLH